MRKRSQQHTTYICINSQPPYITPICCSPTLWHVFLPEGHSYICRCIVCWLHTNELKREWHTCIQQATSRSDRLGRHQDERTLSEETKELSCASLSDKSNECAPRVRPTDFWEGHVLWLEALGTFPVLYSSQHGRTKKWCACR
jgi:hypothetical protein